MFRFHFFLVRAVGWKDPKLQYKNKGCHPDAHSGQG